MTKKAFNARKGNENDFESELISPDVHKAVCIGVFDIGLQEETYENETKQMWKLIIMWEVAEEYTEGDLKGQRKRISQFYTDSLDKRSKLYKLLCSWFGTAYIEGIKADEERNLNYYKLVGKSCYLTIGHKEKKDGSVKYVVEGLTRIPKGEPGLEPSIIIEDDGPDMPEWIQKFKDKSLDNADTENDLEEEAPKKTVKKQEKKTEKKTTKKAESKKEEKSDLEDDLEGEDDLPFDDDDIEDVELEDEELE